MYQILNLLIQSINRYFPHLADLNRHIRAINIFEIPYQCEICDKRFRRKDRVKSHRENVHVIEDEKKSSKRKRK